MKIIISSLVLCILPLTATSRLVEIPSYDDMFKKADLVVIGQPIESGDTKERGNLGWAVVGVATTFHVAVVMKGNKDTKEVILHHYRLSNPEEPMYAAPHFVSFNPPFDPKLRPSYLLFLMKEPDGRYAPVSGQVDPALSSILKLEGLAR